MPIIKKPDYTIFASEAKNGELSAFPDLLRGWGVTIDQTAGKPPMEWFNTLQKRTDEWLTYLSQRGISEWDNTLDYPKNAVVQSGGNFYVSITENKSKSPDKSQSDWKPMADALNIKIKDATLTSKGIVQLSNATDSASEVMAATPKSVKAAYDLASGKYSAQDATTAQKGIVQLSSATDSTSETMAATPKAVKSIADRVSTLNVKTVNAKSPDANGNIQITSSDIFNTQAIVIGGAADLNTYTIPGLYYQPANAQAGTGKNYPEANAGSLEVYKHAGITQIYRMYNSSRSYIRSLYGSDWSAWTKQYDTANKPTAADVGALPSGGTAVAATKLATPRTIAGVNFDGTGNIAIPAGNVGAYTKAEVDSRIAARGAKNTAGKAVNGWWKCGDTGVIFQWGQIPAADGERVVRVNFPVAFPNAVRSVSGIIANPTENMGLDAFLLYTNVNDRTGVRFMLGNTTGGWSMAATWMAIGY